MNLKKKFDKSELTQTELAKKTNISLQSINQWYNDKLESEEVERRIETVLKEPYKNHKFKKLSNGRPKKYKESITQSIRIDKKDYEKDLKTAKKLGNLTFPELYQEMRRFYYEHN